MTNAPALFRSLLVYGICLPMAVVLGYLLATPLDLASLGMMVFVLFVLAAPMLLRWHHIWLIAAWNSTALLFLIPGKPSVWMVLAGISLAISILQYAVNRNMRFLSAPSVVWPLLFFTAVILITARLTGGLFGLRVFGGDTYGAKKYFIMLAAVMGYFAIINRQIPPKHAGRYVALFFLGGATMAIANLPGVINPAFNFLFFLFPVEDPGVLMREHDVVGPTAFISRVTGLALTSIAIFCAMLARYGIRGILDTTKPWRLLVSGFFCLVGLLGGYRSVVVQFVMVLALLFYLERLHHTRMLLPTVFGLLAGGFLLVLFASRLPFPIQRSLAIFPFIPLDPGARLSAQASSDWRVQVWQDVVPQIPQYLLIGKGYSFSVKEQEDLGKGLEGTELVGDYHNGPLSVLLPFGIFGSIAFVWLMIAGIRALHQNYQFGDPAYHDINTFLFAYLVAKVIFFFTVFGSLHSDLPVFLGLLALGISLNGGVAKPVVVPQPKIVFNRFKLHPSSRRPAGA
jgi:hypothetical protein